MPISKIFPLKIESISSGGDENDSGPTEIDPSEDYLTLKGVCFENNDAQLIDIHPNTRGLQFSDQQNGKVSLYNINNLSKYVCDAAYEGERSTPRNEWQDQLLIAIYLPAGKYRINFKYNWSGAWGFFGNAVFQAQVLIDGAQVDYHSEATYSTDNGTSIPVEGFIYQVLSEGSHTFKVQFRAGVQGKKVTIKNTRMEIWRVG